jgi:hypothetical protein
MYTVLTPVARDDAAFAVNHEAMVSLNIIYDLSNARRRKCCGVVRWLERALQPQIF